MLCVVGAGVAPLAETEWLVATLSRIGERAHGLLAVHLVFVFGAIFCLFVHSDGGALLRDVHVLHRFATRRATAFREADDDLPAELSRVAESDAIGGVDLDGLIGVVGDHNNLAIDVQVLLTVDVDVAAVDAVAWLQVELTSVLVFAGDFVGGGCGRWLGSLCGLRFGRVGWLGDDNFIWRGDGDCGGGGSRWLGGDDLAPLYERCWQ